MKPDNRIAINLNDRVYFKLREVGMAIWAKKCMPPEPDENGYYNLPFWGFIDMFGGSDGAYYMDVLVECDGKWNAQ